MGTRQLNDAINYVERAYEMVIQAQNTSSLQHFHEAEQGIQLAQELLNTIDLHTIKEEDGKKYNHAKELLRQIRETVQALQWEN